MDDSYLPMTGRRRTLTVVLAIASAIGTVLLLLYPPGGPDRSKRAPSGPQPCVGANTTDCVGGKVDVIVVPPGAAASGG